MPYPSVDRGVFSSRTRYSQLYPQSHCNRVELISSNDFNQSNMGRNDNMRSIHKALVEEPGR